MLISASSAPCVHGRWGCLICAYGIACGDLVQDMPPRWAQAACRESALYKPTLAVSERAPDAELEAMYDADSGDA